MSAHGSMKRSISMLAACLVLAASAGTRAETIPPDSWVYEALRSFELRGLVDLEPTFPYTRDRVEAYVSEIARGAASRKDALGARQRYLLERLVREFAGKGMDPGERDDGPVLTIRDGGRFAAIDASIGGAWLKRVDREKGEANGLGDVGMLVGLGHGVTMETNYSLVMAPEWEDNGDGLKPDPRTRSFRGLTGEFERGLVAANGDWWELRLGREYMQWGQGTREGLILSPTAGSLDHLGGRIAIGRFALSAFQASLGTYAPYPYVSRYLAGHRLTVALPRGIFIGIGETVLYCANGFEWMYIMPLSIFYVNQANERTNSDNALFSLDLKARILRGLVLSGELLIDDIQYEREEDAGPDRIAFTIGGDGQFVAGGREFGLSGRYTYVDIYTYEHMYTGLRRECITSYVVGDGVHPLNALIGSALGPDADRWDISGRWGVSARVDVRFDASFIRRGEGNGLSSWFPGENPNPPFPSGDVLRERWLSAACSYDLGRNSSLAAAGGARFLEGGPGDLDRTDGFGRLELVLDL